MDANRCAKGVALASASPAWLDYSEIRRVVRGPTQKENVTMKKLEYFAVCAMLTMDICVAQDLVNIVQGTIKKVDNTTKTIVVKTADGTEHTIKVTDAATLKGTKDGSTA